MAATVSSSPEEAEEDDGLYGLPFRPASVHERRSMGTGLCIQGNHGASTHSGTLAYAVDFRLPVGTPVVASRSGVVAAVVSHFSKGGLSAALKPRANFVAVQHGDGTYARYFHLKHHGCSLRPGDQVDAGQQIALSGNTGFSSTPHLHFDIVNMLPEDTCVFEVHDPTKPDDSPLVLHAVIAAFSAALPLKTNSVFRLVKAVPKDASLPLENAVAVKGNAVVIDRGGCSFTTKARRAAEAGAHCMVVINSNTGPELFSMGGTDKPLPMPAVLISSESGSLIKPLLERRALDLHLRYSEGFVRAMQGDERFRAACANAPLPSSSSASSEESGGAGVEDGDKKKDTTSSNLLFVARTKKVFFRSLEGEPYIPRQGVLYPETTGFGQELPPPAGCCTIM